MNKRNFCLFTLSLGMVVMLAGCNFMNVVPDNVPTLEGHSFNLRSNAERFLYTCYSFMPDQGSLSGNPGFLAGGEIVVSDQAKLFDTDPASHISRNLQNVVDPFENYWDGSQSGTALYQGIRDCNIFLENIDQVPDMSSQEKRQWAAEVKFLKAYYLFYLVRMYGPVYLPKKNIPVSSLDKKNIDVFRSPVDSCFNYIIRLLNEAGPDLPDRITDQVANLGRITKTIDYSIKALVWVTAASPFFNGNTDYPGFKNSKGEIMFNQTFDPAKWDSAANAAKEAIDLAQKEGYHLYLFSPQSSAFSGSITDTTITKMSIRNSVTENFNPEVIWANTDGSTYDLQNGAAQIGFWPSLVKTHFFPSGRLGVPLRIVDLFYTNHGVPIEQDKTWNYSQRLSVMTVPKESNINLIEGYKTAYLNFKREPRFYADLAFDGSTMFSFANSSDLAQLNIMAKSGQSASFLVNGYSITGYWPKKLFNYKSVPGSGSFDLNVNEYSWPVMRLADLYLLYAEAENEANGPGSEVYKYINLVRARAGIPSVQDAWSNYSTKPDQYKTKDGMREIIHHEFRIELALEGKSFWALRRWKEAVKVYNTPIEGWSLDKSVADNYYVKHLIFSMKFNTRDYLWPLSEKALLNNPNLTQNPGWGQ